MRFSSKSKKGLILLILLTLAAISTLSATLQIPKSDIIFSHKRHAEVDCTKCHDKIAQSDKSEDKNLPTMEICYECHDGTTLPNECSVCHKNTENPEALVNPKGISSFPIRSIWNGRTIALTVTGTLPKKIS